MKVLILIELKVLDKVILIAILILICFLSFLELCKKLRVFSLWG